MNERELMLENAGLWAKLADAEAEIRWLRKLLASPPAYPGTPPQARSKELLETP